MRSEKGFALAETLIALAVMGIIAVVILSGMATSFNAIHISQERVAAEGLAKSQLEYVKSQDYIPVADYNPEDPANRYQLIQIPSDLSDQGYTLNMNSPQSVVVAGGGWGELQSLTVVVWRNGEEMLTISDYKIGRLY